MSKVYLEPSQVPAVLRGAYTGKKFAVELTETVFIPADAGLWESGSRDTYRALRMVDGAAVALSDNMSAPWDGRRQDKRITLERGIAVIRSSMFQGKDMGLTFYVRPDDAAPLLPPPAAELTRVHEIILEYTAGRKSSYNGKDRYQMARDDAGPYGYMTDKPAVFPTRAEWDAAKAELAGMGLLTKAGAITPAGRNARPSAF